MSREDELIQILLTEENKNKLKEALEEIGVLRSRVFLPVLLAILKRGEERFYEHRVLRAIVAIGDRTAAPVLKDILREQSNNFTSSKGVSYSLIESLYHLKIFDYDLVKQIRKLAPVALKNKNEWVLRAALNYLSMAKDQKSLSLAKKVLGTADLEIFTRETAADTLLTIDIEKAGIIIGKLYGELSPILMVKLARRLDWKKYEKEPKLLQEIAQLWLDAKPVAPAREILINLRTQSPSFHPHPRAGFELSCVEDWAEVIEKRDKINQQFLGRYGFSLFSQIPERFLVDLIREIKKEPDLESRASTLREWLEGLEAKKLFLGQKFPERDIKRLLPGLKKEHFSRPLNSLYLFLKYKFPDGDFDFSLWGLRDLTKLCDYLSPHKKETREKTRYLKKLGWMELYSEGRFSELWCLMIRKYKDALERFTSLLS